MKWGKNWNGDPWKIEGETLDWLFSTRSKTTSWPSKGRDALSHHQEEQGIRMKRAIKYWQQSRTTENSPSSRGQSGNGTACHRRLCRASQSGNSKLCSFPRTKVPHTCFYLLFKILSLRIRQNGRIISKTIVIINRQKQKKQILFRLSWAVRNMKQAKIIKWKKAKTIHSWFEPTTLR